MRRFFASLIRWAKASNGPGCTPVKIEQRREEAAAAMRAELLELIAKIAVSQRWTPEYTAAVLMRARRGPVSDLRPTLSHFRDCTAFYEARRQAQEVVGRHMKRPEWNAGSLTRSER